MSNEEVVSAEEEEQNSVMQDEQSSDEEVNQSDDDKIPIRVGEVTTNEDHIEMTTAELNMTQVSREKIGGG